MLFVWSIQSLNTTDDCFIFLFFITILQAMVCAMATTVAVPTSASIYSSISPNTFYQFQYESNAYDQLQKSLKSLSKAITELLYAARGVEDYVQKYIDQPDIYGLMYNSKLNALENAKQSLNDAYAKAQNEYSNYHNYVTGVPDQVLPSLMN